MSIGVSLSQPTARRVCHYAFGVFSALAIAGATVIAQQAGPNVNVLPAYPIGNAFPSSPVAPPDSNTAKAWALKGDNYLQRQVEPSIAASTYNGDHFLAAYGDYRTVDFANDVGLPGAAASGWIGYSRSYDRGKHWYGAMVPGFPGGTSSADLSSPLHGLQAGSDPVIATTPGGHFYLGGLFFTIGGISNIAVMHLRDVPSLEGGDSIKPGKITIVDKGSQSDTGNLEDKPAIAADIARNTTDPAVCGPVYMAYTVFTGGGDTTPFTTKIGAIRSKQGKCGESWDNGQYINKNFKQNQGTAMAVDPASGKIYVVWRHIFVPGGDGFPDGLVVATSSDFGSSYSAPVMITGADFAPFDQGSISASSDPNHVAFRSEAFPTITVDGFGNVYVAVQEKFAIPSPIPMYNEPRITIRTLRAGSSVWSAKTLVEPSAFYGGQQIMPSLTYGAGSVRAMWYDFRRPEWAAPNDPAWGRASDCDNSGRCYVTGLDRRMETRLAQTLTSSNGNLAFAPSARVTAYNGSKPNVLGGLPAVNRPNLPMFVGGTVAFTGDYITVATASPYVANVSGSNPPFRWATSQTDYAATSSLAAWSDSRDVVFPMGGSGQPELSVANILGWKNYGPAGTGAASCINPGSRDLNVYFSEVKSGVIAGSPATSRQLVDGGGKPFERAFPFYAQNTTVDTRYFRLTFQNDSSKVGGSFVQGTAKQPGAQPAVTSVDVTILPVSTVSKTIYAYCPSCTSTSAFARFSVKAQEITSIGGSFVPGGLTTQLAFNSDPTAPFVTNPKIETTETHAVTLSGGSWANQDWVNQDWVNQDWVNQDWVNQDWVNQDWVNQDWVNTAPVGDLVSSATNIGNNASSYAVSVNLNPAVAADFAAQGYKAALIISRSYNKPYSFANCAIQPIPLSEVISVIPLDLNHLQTTVIDTAAFSATPKNSDSSLLAAGSSSSAAEIQTDQVFLVLRLFAPMIGTQLPPPLTADQQNAISAAATTTVIPQAGDTVAGKTNATVTLSNLTQTYTGAPLSPTATTSQPVASVTFTGAPQVNVGSYPVLATIVDATYQGSATGTFVITPAPSTTVVNCPASVTYSGFPQTPCTATVTGAGGLNQSVPVMYSHNTNAGTATAAASYPGDGNHQGSSASTTFTIAKANATCTVTPYQLTYDGNPHTATGSCTGVGGDGTLSGLSLAGTTHTNAGTYTDTWTFTDVTGNYNDVSQAVSDKIFQASSTTAFGPAPAAAYPGANFTVSASNNSGGTITYSKVSGPCTLVDATAGKFSPTGVGDCIVKADSAATLNYQASFAQQTVAVADGMILWVGNDTSSPVERLRRDGTSIGFWGADNATGTALDYAGHVYTVVPGPDLSVITEYDAAQSVVATINFDTGIENGNGNASWIEDMAYGGNGTLWVSGFNGIVYHISATGAILSHFDTGRLYIGVATDGAALYTTDGASGTLVTKRDFSGNALSSFDTGHADVGGIGYDPTDGTLWVGTFGKIEHYTVSGTLIGSVTTPSSGAYHDGLEVGPVVWSSSSLWIGNDTQTPVEQFTLGGTLLRSWGSSGATGSALDGLGHVYTVVPGDAVSVIREYDAAQNVIATINFNSGVENGNGSPSWIEDMAYGGNGTLWVSGYNGLVYHIDATGAILSQFDTGNLYIGVATDGFALYTTDGESGSLVTRRDFDGNTLSSFDTGIDGVGGIGYDASDGTLWVGSFGAIYHYTLSGTLIGMIKTASGAYHDGIEVGPASGGF